MSDSTTAAAEAATLKRTALYDVHVALGGKIVPFAGYEMPVMYKGIVAEHTAVRERVGMFDVSHMGEVTVRGPRAVEFVQKITVNDAGSLKIGQAQYSAMCRPDGGIVDDLLVYRRAEDDFLLVINGARHDVDWAWMKENIIDGIELADRTDDYSLIAVQGPRSRDTLQKLTDAPLAEIEYYHFTSGTIAGVQAIIARTGYTGELGYELYIASDRESSERVWNEVMKAGEEFGIEPAGLGCRDTLRLEMGFCLYGNDIDETTNPIEAGLGWITKLDKGEFNGADVLRRVKEEKPKRRLVGFELNERAVARQHYPIVVDGRQVGEVTSGTQSPTLGKPIGMGYVESAYARAGTTISIRIRDKEVPATVVKIPFIKKG